jgi:CheY-like chemotaxis protein
MMPVMDGIEAMKRIRSDQARGKVITPIIAFTANAVSTAREMFKSEGFDGFVSKPVDRIELERVMKRVLPPGIVSVEDVVRKQEADAGTSVESEVKAPEKSSEKVSVPDETDMFARLANVGVDTKTGLHYSGGDREFFITLLQQYVKESSAKKKMMRDALESGDLDDYAIQAHSIKSTSKMIGAMELSEKARLLETAGKEGNRSYIDDNQEEMIAMYEKVLAAIKPEGAGPEPEGDNEEDEGVLEFSPDGSSKGGA